jgi:hypothetical protein
MSALASLPSVLRILMLGLLMVGVLMKPVIALAGELHEAGHVQSTDQDGHFQDDASVPVDPSDATNPWHALMHFSHCCGHTPALLPLMYLGSFTPVANEPLPQLSVEFQPAVHPVAFRPPISA